MRTSLSHALWDSLDETGALLFREGSPRRWLSWALAAWLSVLGAAILELPLDALSGGHLAAWLRGKIPALAEMWIPCVCLAVAFATSLAWLRACGLMVFLDCLVRRDGGLRAAWRRQWRNARCLCILWVALGTCAVILGGGLVAMWLWWFRGRGLAWDSLGAEDALVLGSLCAVGVVGAVALGAIGCLVEDIVCPFFLGSMSSGPIMAMRSAANFIRGKWTLMLVYVVTRVGVGMLAVSLIVTVAMLSCGVAILPYVGSLLLLPVHVFWRLFPLLFLRREGLDVWAGGRGPSAEAWPTLVRPPRLADVAVRLPPRLHGPP